MTAVLLALLGGCTLGPDYSRPENEAQRTDFRVSLPAQQAESFANSAWFELFNDPYLETLVHTALNGNPDLGIALARIEEARARTTVTRSAFGPNIRAGMDTNPMPGGESNDATFNAGLGFAWELDIFGKIRRADEAAQARLLATEDGARAVMSTLVVSVASTWYSLLELDEEVRILERTAASQEQSLQLVRSQLHSGVSSRAEEQQAIAQLASTRARLPVARQAVVDAENTLSILLGQGPRDFLDRPRGLPVERVDASGLALGLPVELLEQRPDVRQAEHQLHAATATVGVAVANRFPFPTIGLSGFFGRYAVDFGDIDSRSASTNFSGWGPYVDMPIIDWGAARGNEEVARAGMQQALMVYRSTILRALKEVSDSVHAFEYAAEVIDANTVFKTAAGSSLQLQRERFSNGLVGYLDVLDAERQLLLAEQNLVRSQLQRLQAYLDIYRALGGGWSDSELAAIADARSANAS
ncbi:efflux transporter outer membrane subunit [Parahaliea mediterranea]|uniref:efflux transporter outer membrane subunit n=1 Tax=Parahaliea mediterranea TaxID=651086 RepID=UPI0013006941|nr:efflux transporter outer membrane subunit [Parahaliea mediterranea]